MDEVVLQIEKLCEHFNVQTFMKEQMLRTLALIREKKIVTPLATYAAFIYITRQGYGDGQVIQPITLHDLSEYSGFEKDQIRKAVLEMSPDISPILLENAFLTSSSASTLIFKHSS